MATDQATTPATPKIKNLPLSLIHLDGGTQLRGRLQPEIIDEYAEAMLEGAEFPPITVFYDDQTYWLADGFHRIAARKKNGFKTIAVNVRRGNQREAILHSIGANTTHGLRRTNADKRCAVETLLRDPEWSQWSDREIARRAAVSNRFVGNLRAELDATVKYSQSSQRKGADGRIINVSNIGRSRGPSNGKVNLPSTRPVQPEGTIEAPKPEIVAFQSKQDTLSNSEAELEVVPRSRPQSVQPGSWWQLKKKHFLYCGEVTSPQFRNRLPKEIALFLAFPSKVEHWPASPLVPAVSTVAICTPNPADQDLRLFREMIECSLDLYTDPNDEVVFSYLPDPATLLLADELECRCFCAEPDPERCEAVIKALAAIERAS